MKLWKKMCIGVVLGLLTGILLGPRAIILKPIGTVFIELLNMLVMPLIFSSMIVGVTSINNPRKLGRVGLKTLSLYLVTTIFAIIFGLCFAYLINPGIGMKLDPVQLTESTTHHAPTLSEILLSLVPKNPFASFANGNILQVIIFAIFIGLGINWAGEKGKPILRMMESVAEVMFKITAFVMRLAPYGVFAIMAWVAGSFGYHVLFPLMKLLFAIYAACFAHMVIVFGFILVVMTKVHPRPFLRGMRDAIALAISTTSSSATLPASLHCVQNNLGVPKHIASFMLPLGVTINMNGTAIFQGISAVFVAQAYGIPLGWESILLIVVTATLSAIGAAGIPGGGLVTLSIVLSSVGLPIEGIAIIAGIDRIRDLIVTPINILGDAVAAVYVAKSEKELDEVCYNSEAVHRFSEETS